MTDLKHLLCCVHKCKGRRCSMQEQRWLTFLNGKICLSEHLLWSLVHKIRGVQQKILSTTSVFWKCEHCPMSCPFARMGLIVCRLVGIYGIRLNIKHTRHWLKSIDSFKYFFSGHICNVSWCSWLFLLFLLVWGRRLSGLLTFDIECF